MASFIFDFMRFYLRLYFIAFASLGMAIARLRPFAPSKAEGGGYVLLIRSIWAKGKWLNARKAAN